MAPRVAAGLEAESFSSKGGKSSNVEKAKVVSMVMTMLLVLLGMQLHEILGFPKKCFKAANSDRIADQGDCPLKLRLKAKPALLRRRTKFAKRLLTKMEAT